MSEYEYQALRSGQDNYIYKGTWLQLSRPLTWSGTIAPVLAGSILAAGDGAFRVDIMLALLTATLLIQISANMLNDYFDFKGGQDRERWREATGKGKEGPAHSRIPVVVSILLAVSVAIGLWLAFSVGWWVIIVGTAGITAAIFYSAGNRSLASLGFGECTAFLFLGVATTLLGYAVQTGSINYAATATAVIFGLLISMMILTNNVRDIKKDEQHRRTIAVRLGKKRVTRTLSILAVLPYVVLLWMAISNAATPFILLALPAVFLAFKLPRAFGRSGTREKEIAVMKQAALHHWSFGFLFIAGLLVGIVVH
ncbi:1,4-dihydroxy-2-naphthoate octaprenyltransferase [Salimicrobium salexigens]|uniref:1,4-dihydroxy-2-naphthoate octaprenyltransferase n=1 Tax=Salimicrobium salexigens TaxID=908941 RepID=A0ABY1KKH3_9BACI|nr:1,4-dihydroxy-2-naphthoate octaprenyltransferase [Salimicrobium salexigens]SIS45602.1 1,4-dihydroxy-2-naphthoate prenyltransferase [Salimicrobium salexigens]